MAVKYSIGTGNFTTAGTWGVVDATSYLNNESGSDSLTTLYSGTRSSAFTPGAITVSHIGVKLLARLGTTGTMSVSLRNATIGLDDFVTGTEVTINMADLPASTVTDNNGGWQFFKLASPVLLLAATNYNVQAKNSTSAMASLWRDNTVDNISRALVTTTTGAPAAGDDLIIAREYTGAGTGNNFIVTMNETATTDYGSATVGNIAPAVTINFGGILRNGIAAATNYNLKVSGSILINAGGEFDLGTVATAMPRDSTMTLLFDCGANVDFGITVRPLGTFVAQGLSRSSGKLVYYCKLNTDEAANSTSLGVDTDTGWLDNDVIAVASTTRTGSQTESGALNGAAGASTLTVDGFAGTAGGLLNAHGGASPVQAEVILLTRNVLIQGASATLQAFIDIKTTAIVDCDWVEFKWLGSATASKLGIDIATTTGSVAFTYCSFRDFVVAGSRISIAGAASDNYTFQFCVMYAVVRSISNAATSGIAWVIDNFIIMGTTGTNTVFDIADVGGTITNISSVGNASTGVALNIGEVGANIGTINNLVAHSNAGSNMTLSGFYNGTITTVSAWRGAATGLNLTNLGDVIIDGVTIFGNTNQNYVLTGGKNLIINNSVASGDSTFSTTQGITFGTGGGGARFENSTFGVASGIFVAHTRDINVVAGAAFDVTLNNCLLASSTEVATQTTMPPGTVYGSSKHDQTAGNHKAWKREGTITIDTTSGMYDVTPSIRITPTIANEKCESPKFSSAITSGNALTVSVKVRESVVGDGTDYNGNRPRLIVKRNAAAGIAADTVLATATISSEGAFETLSGTTASVTGDAVLDFIADCDGTTGWVNIDTWAVTSQVNTLGLKYWQDGQAVAYGDNAVGGGGVVKFAGDGGGFVG